MIVNPEKKERTLWIFSSMFGSLPSDTLIAGCCEFKNLYRNEGTGAMQNWIGPELKTSDFGDERLNARYKILMESLSGKPSASIPAACGGWNETIAAYRFFENDRVDVCSVLKPHFDATLKRMRENEIVLVIQDTTEIDVTRPAEKMQGAGPLNDEKWLGFYNHVLLATTPGGIALGVVDARINARDTDKFLESRKNGGNNRKQKPIEEKESFRWLESYRKACEIQGFCPETKVVCVSDSEGDIYECLLEAASSKEVKAEWLVRACQDRAVESEKTGKRTYRKLWEDVESAEVVGELSISVSENKPKSNDSRKRRQKRSKRKTTVEVRAKRIELRAPYRKGLKLANAAINAILVREKEKPKDEPPVEWLLLTTLPIDGFDRICAAIGYYCCRWQIEIYFRVLKSGCRVEELQFEYADRFKPCLALYMIVAWRVMFALMMGRQCPDIPCEAVFDENEWKAVYAIVKKRALPEKPPALGKMVEMVAGLGGWLGRKHDGPPGPKTMWIGLQRARDFAIARQVFAKLEDSPGTA